MPYVYEDPYSECENAAKALLQELTDFFANEWQVSSDDTVIARGADYFAILRPGAFPIFAENNTGQQKDFDWQVIAELYVRYTNYEESWGLFKQVRAAVLWKFNTNPILKCFVQPDKSAKNVWHVSLASEEAAQYFKFADTPDDATPNFIIQTLVITVRQRVEFQFVI